MVETGINVLELHIYILTKGRVCLFSIYTLVVFLEHVHLFRLSMVTDAIKKKSNGSFCK